MNLICNEWKWSLCELGWIKNLLVEYTQISVQLFGSTPGKFKCTDRLNSLCVEHIIAKILENLNFKNFRKNLESNF